MHRTRFTHDICIDCGSFQHLLDSRANVFVRKALGTDDALAYIYTQHNATFLSKYVLKKAMLCSYRVHFTQNTTTSPSNKGSPYHSLPGPRFGSTLRIFGFKSDKGAKSRPTQEALQTSLLIEECCSLLIMFRSSKCTFGSQNKHKKKLRAHDIITYKSFFQVALCFFSCYRL